MPRKIRFSNLPVIKPEVEPVTALKIGTLDPELMTQVLLHLDPVDVLNMCISQKSVRKVCDDELFWKRKTIQDFRDVSEKDEPPRGQTWKNFYFNKVNIHRELKQAIREGNEFLVEELAQIIVELEGEEEKEGFFEDEVHLSVLENQSELTNYFLNNYNVGLTKERGIQIICDQMKNTTRSRYLVKKLYWSYRDLFSYSYPNYYKLMQCAIDSRHITTVKDVYNIVLNTPFREPKAYIRYAKRKGLNYIAKIIQEIHDTYRNWQETL